MYFTGISIDFNFHAGNKVAAFGIGTTGLGINIGIRSVGNQTVAMPLIPPAPST
jgi:hypothetical protein